mmetsp:Transcript_6101/g.16105  ORF Transcript_6101/g.16105 Transcript_6101/m.16105 type:complete len:299 (+) Transcript_6101:305-1201(+)
MDGGPLFDDRLPHPVLLCRAEQEPLHVAQPDPQHPHASLGFGALSLLRRLRSHRRRQWRRRWRRRRQWLRGRGSAGALPSVARARCRNGGAALDCDDLHVPPLRRLYVGFLGALPPVLQPLGSGVRGAVALGSLRHRSHVWRLLLACSGCWLPLLLVVSFLVPPVRHRHLGCRHCHGLPSHPGAIRRPHVHWHGLCLRAPGHSLGDRRSSGKDPHILRPCLRYARSLRHWRGLLRDQVSRGLFSALPAEIFFRRRQPPVLAPLRLTSCSLVAQQHALLPQLRAIGGGAVSRGHAVNKS